MTIPEKVLKDDALCAIITARRFFGDAIDAVDAARNDGEAMNALYLATRQYADHAKPQYAAIYKAFADFVERRLRGGDEDESSTISSQVGGDTRR